MWLLSAGDRKRRIPRDAEGGREREEEEGTAESDAFAIVGDVGRDCCWAAEPCPEHGEGCVDSYG